MSAPMRPKWYHAGAQRSALYCMNSSSPESINMEFSFGFDDDVFGECKDRSQKGNQPYDAKQCEHMVSVTWLWVTVKCHDDECQCLLSDKTDDHPMIHGESLWSESESESDDLLSNAPICRCADGRTRSKPDRRDEIMSVWRSSFMHEWWLNFTFAECGECDRKSLVWPSVCAVKF